jgi:ribonuclease E
MKRMLFNATYQEELRVATVDGQKLVDFDIETSSKAQHRGNIYKGVVTRVEPSLEACFVDYGTEKQGFLPFKEIDFALLPQHIRENGGISKITVGTDFIVQVEKDERGNKGAALTTKISLPGRYLVLMPSNPKSSGISRRIDGEERDELKSVLALLDMPSDMSVIARTAALGRVQQELQWDLDYLLKLWGAIKTAANNNTGSFLIYQESNLVVRSIRDHFSPDITEVLIDTEEIYDQAKLFISHVIPSFADRVKFYNDDVPLFSRFQIEHQIESAYGRMVNLPSGGSIAVDMTEALTAIDVNSAKANKGSDIEATAFATNLEAAEEIARQMRLRDLGGLVVVDFIDMENSKNQREVENFFKQQLSFDRARIQMGKLSRFGLLELSRQRLQSSLEESTTIQCPRCSGIGTIRGIESNSLHILRIIQEEAVKNAKFISALHIQLPVPTATYLLNEKRDDIAKIESRMKVRIVLIPNIHLDSPNYKIRKISLNSSSSNEKMLSFNLVDENEELDFEPQNQKNKTNSVNKALVKNFAPSEKAPVLSTGNVFNGFVTKITSLFKDAFATSSTKQSQNTVNTHHNKNLRNSTTRNQNTINSSKPRPQVAGKPNPKNQSNATTVNTPTNNVNRQPSNPNQRNNNRNNTASSQRNKSHSPQRVADNNKAEKPIASSLEQNKVERVSPVIAPKLDNVVQETRVNQGVASSWIDKSQTVTVSDSSDVRNITAKDKDSVNKIINNEVLPSIQKDIPKPTTPKKIEPVDLGDLQMVATDKTIMQNSVLEKEVQFTGKRYSDILAEKPPVSSEKINYEIVETTK